MSRSSEGQDHNAAWLWKGLDLSNNMCEYELNQLTNEEENQALTQIVNNAGKIQLKISAHKTGWFTSYYPSITLPHSMDNRWWYITAFISKPLTHQLLVMFTSDLLQLS